MNQGVQGIPRQATVQGDPEDTWYPARDLKNSPYAIRTYRKQHPEGPPPPKRLSAWARCFEAEEQIRITPTMTKT